MRLLLDESVPAKLKRHLPSHTVRTAVEMGWSGIKNGRLLELAGAEFEALLTVDKNMPFQQNLSSLPVALVVLDSFSNELHVLLHLLPRPEQELAVLTPRSYVLVKSAV